MTTRHRHRLASVLPPHWLAALTAVRTRLHTLRRPAHTIPNKENR